MAKSPEGTARKAAERHVSQYAFYFDQHRCTGCKKCITEIGCPGIGFDPNLEGPRSGSRGQAFIDPALCNGCDLCIKMCKFDAIKRTNL